MKIFQIFDHSSEKDFATHLVQRLVKELPPSLMGIQSKVLSVNKITRLLERTYELAENFKKEKKLGFVKRAVLANHFKWTLREQKYPEDFIKMATEGLVVALSKVGK